MEHLVIYFYHNIGDIVPYCDFVRKIRPELEINGLGQYLGDDMAIDGGDAEAIFSCISAKELFEFLKEDIAKLQFMRGAKVTFVFGELDAEAKEESIYL